MPDSDTQNTNSIVPVISNSTTPSSTNSSARIVPHIGLSGRLYAIVRQWIHRVHIFGITHRTTIQWTIPLGLIILWLIKRRIDRTRAALYAARRADFWVDSFQPPYDAPSKSLPHPLHGTQLLYSLLPIGVQRGLRNGGAFRAMADYGTLIGGALIFAWQPRIVRRMFGPREGRVHDLPYGPLERHTIDVMWTHRTEQVDAANSTSTSKPLSPVLLFVHGGAWGSGNKEMYRLFLQQMDEQLCMVTMAMNYRVYPDGDINVQIDDLSYAVEWAYKHAPTWGGDPQRIYLMGHSSGAHCASLYLLRQLSSHGELKVPIRGFIGLSGPFDIADHYEFEAARGVHEISPMKAANGDIDGFPASSAPTLALKLTPEQRAKMPPVLLLHGLLDTTVPYGSSVKFAYALAGSLDPQQSLAVPIAPLPSHDLYHGPRASSTDALKSFTFSHPRSPLIHVRIVGGETDPQQCDHASFIFDIMRTRSDTVRSSNGKTEKQVTTVGHTRWIMESIQEFMNAIGSSPFVAPRTTATSVAPSISPILARL